jgi:hypothetical protein
LCLDLDDEPSGLFNFPESGMPLSSHNHRTCYSLEGKDPGDDIALGSSLLLQATPDKSTEAMRLKFCQVTLVELHTCAEDGLISADEITTSSALKG